MHELGQCTVCATMLYSDEQTTRECDIAICPICAMVYTIIEGTTLEEMPRGMMEFFRDKKPELFEKIAQVKASILQKVILN